MPAATIPSMTESIIHMAMVILPFCLITTSLNTVALACDLGQNTLYQTGKLLFKDDDKPYKNH
jgi:hypothetical protein